MRCGGELEAAISRNIRPPLDRTTKMRREDRFNSFLCAIPQILNAIYLTNRTQSCLLYTSPSPRD